MYPKQAPASFIDQVQREKYLFGAYHFKFSKLDQLPAGYPFGPTQVPRRDTIRLYARERENRSTRVFSGSVRTHVPLLTAADAAAVLSARDLTAPVDSATLPRVGISVREITGLYEKAVGGNTRGGRGGAGGKCMWRARIASLMLTRHFGETRCNLARETLGGLWILPCAVPPWNLAAEPPPRVGTVPNRYVDTVPNTRGCPPNCLCSRAAAGGES